MRSTVRAGLARWLGPLLVGAVFGSAAAGCGEDVTCGPGTAKVGEQCVAVAADVQCGPGTVADGGKCWLAVDAAAPVEVVADAAAAPDFAAETLGQPEIAPETVPETAAPDVQDTADALPCSCPDGKACLPDGSCPACLPMCGTKTCGDDGCGGSCGSCLDPAKPVCLAGECTACVASCGGANCGPDGCGGNCGNCESGTYCLAGICGFAPPEASCKGLCGGVAQGGCSCKGDCEGLGTCCIDFADTCGCVPSCDGKTCGPDGCGGSCGGCKTGSLCQSGSCIKDPCVPDPCSGHGACAAATGACTCAKEFSGLACEKCAAGLVGYPECTPDLCQTGGSTKTCSGHGSCVPKTGVCACELGFDGPACATCTVAGAGFPDCANPCAGKVCDDKNPCTTDSCNAKGACVFAANQAKCDDGNPCTEGEACAAGACTAKANLCQFAVNSHDDSDDGKCDASHCSLREAIAAANVTGKAAKVGISKGFYITLGAVLPKVTVPLHLDGLGLGAVVDGADKVRLLHATAALTLRRLNLRGGATDGPGGPVLAEKELVAHDVVFIGNAAKLGGGAIHGQAVALLRCTFKGNHTGKAATNGGAVVAQGTANVRDCWFDGNNAGSGGGALALTGNVKNSVVAGCTFSANQAASSGGAVTSTHLYLTIVNSTFVGNLGAAGGAAVDLAGPTSLLHVTLAADATAKGKAQLFAATDLTLGNSVLVGAGAIPLCETAVTPTTVANWIGDGSCAANWSGNPASPWPLGKFGAGTPTLAMPAASTAVEAGDLAVCGSVFVEGVDQRGLARPQGKGCDLGAVETTTDPCADLAATATCSDGNACTAGDLCANGNCKPGAAVVCDDGNACSADTCLALTGCVLAVGPTACDDGDACTTKDACQGGVCLAGAATTCDDGNACTADACKPASGCVHSPMSGACSDSDLCTDGDVCAAGVCVAGKKLCALPALPGLAAHYNAAVSASLQVSGGAVAQWQDLSGNGRHLTPAGGSSGPKLEALGINGQPAVDFGNGSGLFSAPFDLTAELTFCAVVRYETPKPWGSLAHHGNRDTDWSLEHNGLKGGGVVHFQSQNDNSGAELTLNPSSAYVLCGRIAGGKRYFSATTTATSWVEAAGASMVPGKKALYVGRSDNGEASLVTVGEVLYYGKALTDAERDAVIAYLRVAWGL